MTAKEMQSLRTGAQINYRGKVGTVVDWKCNSEPTFTSAGERIDAEPVFLWSDRLKHTIHPAFWSEVRNPSSLKGN